MPVRLFVGNLPYETNEAELRQHFGSVGPLSHVFLPVDRETGRPRGFAFVEFAEKAHADAAIAQLNNQPFKGRTMSVSEARAREDRPSGPGGFGSRPPGGPGPRPDWSSRPPRPIGVGPSGPPPAPDGRARNFGPDAPRRGKAKPTRQRRDEGPKGPIRVKSGGRIYAVDDFEDEGGTELFDPFAAEAAEALPDEGGKSAEDASQDDEK
jgi:RNA recognition motif-containing protein